MAGSIVPPVVPEKTVAGQAADEILRRSGVSRGYCLDLACGDGRLGVELARRSGFQIYAVDSEHANVEKARRRLSAAGLYGVRVTVQQADPATVRYPNYFADLVVSGRSVNEGLGVVPREAAQRMLKPYGGFLCLGRPGAMTVATRGPLEGAASWTHQYADAGNTLCSADTRPHSPMTMLWFRDVDLLMPSRHGRGPAPLVDQGCMIVEGLELRCGRSTSTTAPRFGKFACPRSLPPTIKTT